MAEKVWWDVTGGHHGQVYRVRRKISAQMGAGDTQIVMLKEKAESVTAVAVARQFGLYAVKVEIEPTRKVAKGKQSQP